nr:plasmid pRiA4b ORF-3 family protein [Roseicella aerolata]
MRLRVALRDVMPTPWRRLEVAAATTLADLHSILQAAMGWEDLHLHHFRILGRGFDPGYADFGRVRLADLRLRAGERFTYEYNLAVPWRHEIRVEAVGPGVAGRRYPRCTDGRHAAPPEWCPGPEALDELKGELLGLSYVEDLDLMAEFGRAVLDMRDGRVCDVLDVVGADNLRRALVRQECREALTSPFDRHGANAALHRLATADRGAVP